MIEWMNGQTELVMDEHYNLTIPYWLILASLSQTNITIFVSFSGVNLLHKSTAYIIYTI